MRILASTRRDFSTVREYWLIPTAASIPTMIMTTMSSMRVKLFLLLGLVSELSSSERESVLLWLVYWLLGW